MEVRTGAGVGVDEVCKGKKVRGKEGARGQERE